MFLCWRHDWVTVSGIYFVVEKELGEDEEQGGPAQNKWGIGGINRPDRGTYCPLHFAVRERHSVGTGVDSVHSWWEEGEWQSRV